MRTDERKEGWMTGRRGTGPGETVKEIENEMSSRDETGKHVRLASLVLVSSCPLLFKRESSSKQK